MKRLIPPLLSLVLSSTGIAAQVAVIAHKSIAVDKIGKSQLLDLYTGDKSFWHGGKPAIVFDLKQQSETRRIYYRFLGMRSSRIKSIWLKRMLSGDAEPPKSFASEEEMLKRVASTPGAVGFVAQSKVNDDVKVIAIIKKK